MIALNIAPGLFRSFAAEKWPFVGKNVFTITREEAASLRIERPKTDVFFFGSDIDGKVVETATRNAQAAGVSDYVRFIVSDAFSQTPEALKKWTNLDRQLVLTNPPYGGRLMTPEDAFDLFRRIADTYLDENGFCRKGIRLSVISPDDSFEKAAVRPADKRRKLYNGNIRCQMNHYFRMARENQNGV
jgi:putative N6-adenine-specific DNA methylase